MSKSKTLLIVDDSRVSRLMIRELVHAQEPDWQILEADNADQALALAESQQVDCYSIDLNMPGMDGLAFIECLRERKQGGRMAILTANQQQGVVDRCQALQAGCIHKPINEASVASLLEYFHG